MSSIEYEPASTNRVCELLELLESIGTFFSVLGGASPQRHKALPDVAATVEHVGSSSTE
jgi:hypothetical protein